MRTAELGDCSAEQAVNGGDIRCVSGYVLKRLVLFGKMHVTLVTCTIRKASRAFKQTFYHVTGISSGASPFSLLFSSLPLVTMGTQKKEKQRRVREGDVRDGNLRVKGENFYRDAKKVKHLQMYNIGRAKRNAKGEIVRAANLQSTDAPIARVDPNKKWFGNTRVIAQDALTHFREAMGDKKHDTYSVLLRRNKLPMSLLDEKDTTESPTARIVETESFASTFGPKQQRKKPRTQAASSLEELAQLTEDDSRKYEEKQELDATMGLMGNSILDSDDYSTAAKESIFHKGQSKRIWNELYKVIDSSDVVIHVLDARDPLGTRCESVEKYIKTECPHKHLVYVLNKCDLVPTWVAVCILTSAGPFVVHYSIHYSDSSIINHQSSFDPKFFVRVALRFSSPLLCRLLQLWKNNAFRPWSRIFRCSAVLVCALSTSAGSYYRPSRLASASSRVGPAPH